MEATFFETPKGAVLCEIVPEVSSNAVYICSSNSDLDGKMYDIYREDEGYSAIPSKGFKVIK